MTKSRRKKQGLSPRSKKLLTLTVLGCVISMTVLVYNMDHIYLANHHNATFYVPETILSDADNTMLVMTTDSEGQPLSNRPVEIVLVSGNVTEVLFKGKTGEDGVVQPTIRPPPGNNTARLRIKAGKEVVERTVVVEDTIKLMISMDKPIYQPGQVVHLRTLAFEGVSARASERSVTLEVESPAGDMIFREELEANDYGIASMDYPLSNILPLGYYKVNAYVGTESASRSFLVKRYVLPKFRIDLPDLESWYTVDQTINATVNCEYFFGKVVEGDVRITASTYYGVWSQIFTAQGQLRNGEFGFQIPRTDYAVGLPYNSNNGYLSINVTVTDEAGHAEQKSVYVSISREPIILTALSDLNVRGVESRYYLVARYPDGVPVPHAIIRYGFGYGDYTRSTQTDERGVGTIEFDYNGQSHLSIMVKKDGLSSDYDFNLYEHRGIKVVASQAHYEIGQTADFDVFYSGNSLTTTVYYEILSKGFVMETGRAQLDDGRVSIEIPVTPDMVPLSEMRVYKVERDLNVAGDRVMFGVGEMDSLDVSVRADRDVYKPREEVTLNFQVSENGEGVPAALGVSIVDQAVFEINSRYEGFERLMFELEEDFVTPQYQICDYIFTNKDVSVLPTNTSEVISLSSDKGMSMESTWAGNVCSALELRDDAVNGYWMVLMLLGVLGYFGLLVAGYKRKALLALGVALIIAVPGMLAMYSMTIGYGGGSAGSTMMMGGASMSAPLDDASSGRDQLQGLTSDAFIMEGVYSSPGAEERVLPSPTVVRQFFPETWYWNPCIITDENGEASLSLMTPDSITAWNVDVTASTKDARFGTGSGNITVFQDFFIEPDVPVSVIRGDEFPLRILIYNYLNSSTNVTVVLDSEDWFDLVSPESQTVEIGANTVGSVLFNITAEQVGWHLVNVTGYTNALADAVSRRIYVEPDGKNIEKSWSGQLEDDDVANHTVEINPDSIPFSNEAYVKFEAGMDAVVLEGAENYIHFVSGCGEQSTSRLSVDIAAYKNLLNSGVSDLDLFEYETILTQGIQHELIYLTDNTGGHGRAICWHTGEPADLWLTAWALFAFQDLRDVGFAVDDAIIEDLHEYIVSTQNSDGSYTFPSVGHWSINSELLGQEVAATAYMTRSLLYSGMDARDGSISRGVDFIESNIGLEDSAYTLSLSLLALEMADGSDGLRESVAQAVVQAAHRDETNGTAWWSWSQNGGEYRYYYQDNSIETTGYALMALGQHGGNSELVRGAVKYLLTHRSGGCFGSTHDTAVAFQALNSFGEMSIDEMTVQVYADSVLVDTLTFDDATGEIARFVNLLDFLNGTTDISLASTGTGTLLYTIHYSEHVPWGLAGPSASDVLDLSVTYDTTQISVDDLITATVRLKYTGSGGMLKMVLVDLRSPAGFSFEAGDFEELMEDGVINQYEIKDRQAIIYIDDVISDQTIEFEYRLRANMPIRGTIQGIKAYDMYDPNVIDELGPVEVVVSNP